MNLKDQTNAALVRAVSLSMFATFIVGMIAGVMIQWRVGC